MPKKEQTTEILKNKIQISTTKQTPHRIYQPYIYIKVDFIVS